MSGVSLGAASSGVSPLWYAARATGVVALVLLTLSVLLGIAGAGRLTAPGLPRVVTAGLHRNVSLLVLGFVAIHVLSTVLDSYAPIGLTAAVVPFSSPYRRWWLGLGAVVFDLLAAVALTSLLRDRLSYRAWRWVHWAAYACWPVALWHGLGTGTDSRLSWLLALDASCVASVAGAVCWRLSLARPGHGRWLAVAGTLLVPLATAIFVWAGPLQPGWARRAGTPVALLGSAKAVAGPDAAAGVREVAGFSGRAGRQAGRRADELTIRVSARVTGGIPAQILTIVLRGRPDGRGIELASGTVQLGSAGQAAALTGPVTGLDGHQLTAVLRGARGPAQADITLIITGGRAAGQLILRPAGRS